MLRRFGRTGWALVAAGALGLTPLATAKYPQPSAVPSAIQNLAVPHVEAQRVELAWLGHPTTFGYTLSAISTSNGLELHGFVPNEAVHEQALSLARQTTVLPFQDLMRVHPGVASRPTSSNTGEMDQQAKQALSDGLSKQATTIEVTAQGDGCVTLRGSVATLEQRLQASRAMQKVHGCTCVSNQLAVAESAVKRKPATVAFAADSPLGPIGEPAPVQTLQWRPAAPTRTEPIQTPALKQTVATVSVPTPNVAVPSPAPKPAPQPVPKPLAKVETKLESKPVVKTEIKPEPKTVVKAEPKPEVKIEVLPTSGSTSSFSVPGKPTGSFISHSPYASAYTPTTVAASGSPYASNVVPKPTPKAELKPAAAPVKTATPLTKPKGAAARLVNPTPAPSPTSVAATPTPTAKPTSEVKQAAAVEPPTTVCKPLIAATVPTQGYETTGMLLVSEEEVAPAVVGDGAIVPGTLETVIRNLCGSNIHEVKVVALPDHSIVVKVKLEKAGTEEKVVPLLLQLPEMAHPNVRLEISVP